MWRASDYILTIWPGGTVLTVLDPFSTCIRAEGAYCHPRRFVSSPILSRRMGRQKSHHTIQRRGSDLVHLATFERLFLRRKSFYLSLPLSSKERATDARARAHSIASRSAAETVPGPSFVFLARVPGVMICGAVPVTADAHLARRDR